MRLPLPKILEWLRGDGWFGVFLAILLCWQWFRGDDSRSGQQRSVREPHDEQVTPRTSKGCSGEVKVEASKSLVPVADHARTHRYLYHQLPSHHSQPVREYECARLPEMQIPEIDMTSTASQADTTSLSKSMVE